MTALGEGSELPGHRQTNGKFCSTDMALRRLLALTFPAAEIAFFVPWRGGAAARAANQKSDLPAAAIAFSQKATTVEWLDSSCFGRGAATGSNRIGTGHDRPHMWALRYSSWTSRPRAKW